MSSNRLFSLTEINNQLQLEVTEADYRTTSYKKIMVRQILDEMLVFTPYSAESNLNDNFFRFCLSFLILSEGEELQRTLIQKINNPKLRNIEFKVKETAFFLNETMRTKDYSLNINKAQDILQRAFQEFRKDLGLPEIDPLAISYRINDAVISKASSDELKEFLNKRGKKSFIFDNDLIDIESELMKYPDDHKIVLEAIKKNSSRDHISACSISGTEEIPYLSIVSPDSKYIHMESWKFLALIERSKESLVLHNYTQTRKYEQIKQKGFSFNNNQQGKVIGKFRPDTSSFIFACEIGNNNLIDKSVFIIDMSYILCAYVTLRRIHDDRVRFIQLKEQAQSLDTYQYYFNDEL